MSGPGGVGGGGRRGLTRVAAGGGPDGPGGSKGLWAKYLELLESSPVMTRCVTCGVLNGLGDVFSQLVLEQQAFDLKRFTTFTLLGLLFVGPVLTAWYGVLGRIVTAPGTTGVVLSVAIDQMLFAPLFIASFMAVLTTIEGKPENILPKLKQDLPEAVKVNWLLWVPAQYINFQFVPPNLRMLAVNVVALLWNCYMSYQGHKAVVEQVPSVQQVVPAGKGR